MATRFSFSLGILIAVAFVGRGTSVLANFEEEDELVSASPTPMPMPTSTPVVLPPTPKPTPYYPTTNPWASPTLPSVPLKAPIIYGTYNRGCALGLQPIALSHKYWEIVNDARNRYYAHPDLWKIFERVAAWSVDQARLGKIIGGDFTQPAGGPMTDGHNSHQIGLDGDIRFKFFPADRTMSPRQKSNFSETDVADYYITKTGAGTVGLVARLTNNWRDDYGKLLEQFATEPKIDRIFVSPAIKRRMCELYGVPVPTPTPLPAAPLPVTTLPTTLAPPPTPSPTPIPLPTPLPPVKKNYPSWLVKLRPILGHTAHFHIRISCPKGMRTCESQGSVGIENADKSGVECEGPRLQYWFETDPQKNGFLREWVLQNMPPPKPTPIPTLTPTPAPAPVFPPPVSTPKKLKRPIIEEVIRFEDHPRHTVSPVLFGAEIQKIEMQIDTKNVEDHNSILIENRFITPPTTATPVPTQTPTTTPTPVPPRWQSITHSLPKECKKIVRWGEPPPPLSTPMPPQLQPSIPPPKPPPIAPTPFPPPGPIKPKSCGPLEIWFQKHKVDCQN